jgi:hypothetical protein
VKKNTPLVVFVGSETYTNEATAIRVNTRYVDGFDGVTCRTESLGGYPAKCIVIATPDGKGWMKWSATLKADATDAEIKKAVIQSEVFFGKASSADGSFLSSGSDALDEVNAQRKARGLRPYIRDEGLTQAAQSAAAYRAARGIAGHTPNDFSHLPSGANATAAGCAAWPVGMEFGSCCLYENFTYCGAAYVVKGNTRYMHVFVK